MVILLVASSFNSMSQRIYAELTDRAHTVDVVLASHGDDAVRAAVHDSRPDLIIAPELRTALPEDIWSAHTCFIVHFGPPGDRGPSALDWTIATGASTSAVTVLQAEAEMDAGDIWADVPFPVPDVGKSDLYRNEVADAAVEAVLLAVERFTDGAHKPQRQSENTIQVRYRDSYRQHQRRIDWSADSTDTVLRKLRGADSQPGVLDELFGEELFLHGGRSEDRLRGRPGALLATRAGAICRATKDGAVWIPELRPRRTPGGPTTYKLPATHVLDGRLTRVPPSPVPLELPAHRETWADIRYRQAGEVGFLKFGFPGGAMSSQQCRRLLAAYRFALTRPTRVLVLGGSRDFFSTGIHLHMIESAADRAAASWENINAMDDLVEAILRTTDRLVVAAIGGNAAAGGVGLALAADEIWCRAGAVLNPHYRRMGLYGSELWTYTLPKRVGADGAAELMEEAVPLSAASAARRGLVDRLVATSAEDFSDEVGRMAGELAAAPGLEHRIQARRADRLRDEAARPLAEYRRDELARMHDTFFTAGAPYHALRSAFVHKAPRSGSARPLAPATLDTVGAIAD